MRIFGADSFSGFETSMSSIPANRLKKGDLCLLNIDALVTYYKLVDNAALVNIIPYVIPAKYGFGQSDHPSKKWVLCDETINRVTDLSGNIRIANGATSVSATFGSPLASDNYTIFTTITNDIDPEPSMYMSIVSGLSENGFTAKFSGAIDSDNYFLNYFLKLISDEPNGLIGNVSLDDGSTSLDITFGEPLPDNDYTVLVSISNTIDPDPSMYMFVVSDITVNGFKVRFSDKMDSSNYKLNYFIKFY